MKNIILAMGLAIGLVGCAAPKYNYVAVPQNVSKPPIGSVNEAYVGDQLLVQGTYTERDAYYVPEAQKKFLINIPKGYYLKTGEDQNGSHYSPLNNIPDGANIPNSSGIISLLVTNDNSLCLISMYLQKSCHFKDIGENRKVSVAMDNSFQQTLIYSGKVGNKINIGYREFSSSVARPAFNNDVEYDLSESKQIGYKGALLEIIDATNQSIKYKVLRNFNKVN
ncbi:hypothetical protein GPS47_11510 [Acinetobacter haemolyticus]|uniref:hypothetical protein n=1 Tax=Acinetobacter haemolyticus TaxID=29430 RepID=UPI0013731ED9|nr:hypothetical protein [Acinetobacter haemolyticus]NAS06211.1 hypothetical protein [Acinetobacter haemolyticus]